MPTAAQDRFSIADRVIHPAKPEWGVGTVASASNIVQDGTPCQRLAIRFDRAGLKTITTAGIHLKRASSATVEPKPAGTDPFGPLPAASGSSELPDDPKLAARKMEAVPDDATDPFIGPGERLRRVLALYRFEPTPGSLIDWATAQSSLADPLSRFSRHELEEHFRTFRRNLDRALSKAVADASRVEPDELRAIARAAPPDGQRALQALHRRR